MPIRQNCRDFLAKVSLAAAAGVLGARRPLAEEGPPETTRIRLRQTTTICFAPLYVVEAFLRAEGFTEVQYVTTGLGVGPLKMVERGDLDFDANFAGRLVYHLDAGLRITALAGLHAGCFELFAREPIRTISDLKGRRVGIQTVASSAHLYVSIMAAHVGLDPHADIDWVTSPDGNALEAFIAGETDAFLGFPPEPQELRARGVKRVILNTTTDKPWSQYFCCMVFANNAWIRDHPVATKRFLRAVFKAADFCQAEPETAARQLVDGGFTERYDYALQTIEEVPYQRWREFDPEDTMRFYALRLHEVGMISAHPNQIIADGTDFRLVEQLRRELKA